jgi:hypothetical protein
VRAPLTAHDGGRAATGNTPDLDDRGDDAVRRVAVVETWGDEQLARQRVVPRVAALLPAGTLGSVDCRTGRVVEFDRHHHSG